MRPRFACCERGRPSAAVAIGMVAVAVLLGSEGASASATSRAHWSCQGHNKGVAELKKANYAQAFKLFIKSAKAGCPLSQMNLANLYGQGMGVDKSMEQARYWWQQAADLGHGRACMNLAQAMEAGDGGPKDPERASHYFECAAEMGELDAECVVANGYLQGAPGMEKNVDRSYAWIRLAAFRGYSEAQKTLIGLRERLPPAEIQCLDRVAVKWMLSYDARDEHAEQGALLPGRSGVVPYMVHSVLAKALATQGSVGWGDKPADPKRDSPAAVIRKCREALREWKIGAEGDCYFLQDGDGEKEMADAIVTDKSALWAALRPGDAVFLADDRTSHYTEVFSVDLQKERVSLIDAWPRDIFLRQGLNNRGVAAKLVDYRYGKKLVEISKREFMKVILGVTAIRDARKPAAAK